MIPLKSSPIKWNGGWGTHVATFNGKRATVYGIYNSGEYACVVFRDGESDPLIVSRHPDQATAKLEAEKHLRSEQ